MFQAHVLIIRRSKLHYTASGIITPIGVMIPEGLIWPFFFEGTVTSEAYLEMLRSSILPAIRSLYENSEVFYQQDGAPPH